MLSGRNVERGRGKESGRGEFELREVQVGGALGLTEHFDADAGPDRARVWWIEMGPQPSSDYTQKSADG